MKHYMIEGRLNEGVPIDDEYRRLNREHHSYVQKYFDAGKIIVSGQVSGGGGVVFLRLDDESAADFCDNDPLTTAGIHRCRITQFDAHFALPAVRWRHGVANCARMVASS